MGYLLNSLAPIFLVIAAGALLVRKDFFAPEFFRETNRLIYWVGMPCLLVAEIAAARFELGRAGRGFFVLLAATLFTTGLAWACLRPLRLAPSQAGTFIQSCFRGNLFFMGLPVIVFAMPRDGAFDPVAFALLCATPLIIIYNFMSVAVLVYYGGAARQGASVEGRTRGHQESIGDLLLVRAHL